jgi:hypothetical protein
MQHKSTYHVVYLPGDEAGIIPDEVVAVLKTEDPRDVALKQIAAPGAISMQLDSESAEEVPHELMYLGFSY